MKEKIKYLKKGDATHVKAIFCYEYREISRM